MKVYLGIDGGGTKTLALMADEQGRPMASFETTGLSHHRLGENGVLLAVENIVVTCLQMAHMNRENLAGVCIGLPLYGEDQKADLFIRTALEQSLPAVQVVNDAEVGWAGSLGCKPGINIVAGTGSIVFGRDQEGKSARAGGWSEHFSDEGSSYWLALRGMELFTRQADGRTPKGRLYYLIREHFHLEDDFAFVPLVEKNLLPFREKTADFQKLVSQAADQGDVWAIDLYRQAAVQLFELVWAVRNKLNFQLPISVAYSGGTFKAGEKLIRPFSDIVEEKGLVLIKPCFTPVEGALLLAGRTFGARDYSLSSST